MYILIVILKALLIALPLIIAVAYFTLVERKVMAVILLIIRLLYKLSLVYQILNL